MELLLFHAELVGLSMMVVGLYALRPRLGLAPIYMGLGLILSYMMIAGHLRLYVPVAGSDARVNYTSLCFLPLVLVGIALVYTLEGTSEARRLLGTVVVIKVMMNVLKWVMSFRLTEPGVDITILGREGWAQVELWPTTVSTVAIVAAAAAIVVVYQALINLTDRMPVVVALSVALVSAMLTDAVVFAGLSGWLGRLNAHMLGKLTSGIAVSVPAALFIAWKLRKESAATRRGVLERGTFEIVGLRRQIHSMQADLSRHKAEFDHLKHVFGRYVVPDVVDELLRDTSQLELGGQVRDVTILFSDIRGYSTLSEHMTPTETIDLLNRYFGAMSKVIDAERGTIIEFEGDAILAVFGAPLEQPDHADRAVRTAIAMHAEVERLNRTWTADGTAHHWLELGLADFRIRIGIHSGQVVVGNVGSETRTKYAVIGDTVNTAARVEQLNKALRSRMLFTRPVLDRLAEPPAGLIDMGSHAVRGRAEAVEVYTVDGMQDAVEPGVASVTPDEALAERATAP